MTWTIGNEVGNKATYAATETMPGVAAVPDYQWLGTLDINQTQDIVQTEESTGGYDRMVTPQWGIPTFSGTYAESLTFESLPMHMQYAVKAGAVGVTDANTVPGFTYTQAPSFATDDVASATLQYGINGLAWQSTGVRHNEFTLNVDVDDADGVWKFNSNLTVGGKTKMTQVENGVVTSATTTVITMTGASWTINAFTGMFVFMNSGSHIGAVRKIVSNTATTITVDEAYAVAPTVGAKFVVEDDVPVIAVPEYEKIPTYGTQVFIDDIAGTIGTTEITDRIISVSMTYANNRTTKRFLDNAKETLSNRSGRGGRKVTGQIVFELDRRDEYLVWLNQYQRKLRILQEGSEIDSTAGTNKLAQIDLGKVAFSTPTEGARESNMTVTVPFTAYKPSVGNVIDVVTKNKIAVLP